MDWTALAKNALAKQVGTRNAGPCLTLNEKDITVVGITVGRNGHLQLTVGHLCYEVRPKNAKWIYSA